MVDDLKMKDVLSRFFRIGGIECGHHITFYKWSPSGADVGQVEIESIAHFRKMLTDGDGEYFLDLDNVKIVQVGALPFFVSYLGFNLSFRDGKWSVQSYSDEEELPHDVDVKTLEERSHILSQKVLSIIQLVSELASAAT